MKQNKNIIFYIINIINLFFSQLLIKAIHLVVSLKLSICQYLTNYSQNDQTTFPVKLLNHKQHLIWNVWLLLLLFESSTRPFSFKLILQKRPNVIRKYSLNTFDTPVNTQRVGLLFKSREQRERESKTNVKNVIQASIIGIQ